MTFLKELKRRKVWQVAAAYAVVTWLLVQIVTVIKEPLHLPPWFDTAVIVLLALGFPIAIILSWAYALTPEGIVRDDGPGANDDIAAGTGDAPDTDSNGRSLDEVTAGGSLSTARLLRLALRIADALVTSHASGVVRGCLMPSTVMVGDGDVISFRRAEFAPRQDAGIRAAYMAPEQRRGADATALSDQFAFGALLFHMATGQAVPVTTSGSASAIPVTRINAQIPMPMEWFIRRCLADNPEERFPGTAHMRDELAAIAASLAQAAHAVTAARNNLPAQTTTLIGRVEELQRIRQLITAGDARLVTLTGTGGIGKTRLLLELGRCVLKEFRGGVYFVPLDRIIDHELVASEMMSALALQRIPELTSAEALEQHLRQHYVAPTLLLVDNFEHLLPAAPLLTKLLAATPYVTIVVTSRAALRVYGEHEYNVMPLGVPVSAGAATSTAESPAVQLFLDRATWMMGAGAARRTVGEAELRIVAEICERLDGLPLAIELAAARGRVLSLPAMLEQVRTPLQFLAGGARDLPARQQTLRATLDWSYDLLEPAQQKLFRRLGVFVGGASLEAAEAVCNVKDDLDADLIAAIEILVESNLLRTMETGSSRSRFAMPDTMREYALARLTEAGELEHTRRAHAAYCRVMAEESSQVSSESEREALFQQFEIELGNLRAALAWLMAVPDLDWAMRLACALGQFLQQRGRVLEGFERLSVLLQVEGRPVSAELRSTALAWRGEFAMNCGKFDAARESFLESLVASRNRNHVPGILRGLNGIAAVLCRSGSHAEATPYLEEALAIVRDSGGAPSLAGSMVTNIASIVMQLGAYDRARELHAEAAQLFEQAGDQLALAWSFNHQGDVERNRGNLAAARRLYDDALSRFRQLNERLGVAGTLHDLAWVAASSGDHAEAISLNREALAMYCTLDHKADVPRVLDALAVSAAASEVSAGHALTLAGGAAAMRKAYGLHLKQALETRLEESLERARTRLGSQLATESWLKGWRMRPEQAIELALAAEEASAS